MTNYEIPVIPGDGIGPEVIEEGIKVIDTIGEIEGFKVNWIEYSIGAERYLETGISITDDELEELSNYKAMFLGALGDPRVKPGVLELGVVVKIRHYMDQYINYRPVKLYNGVSTPLKNREGIDFIILRENIEDFYIGLGDRITNHKKTNYKLELIRKVYKANFNIDLETTSDELAYNIGIITRENSERLMRYGFELAKNKKMNKVTCVDKMNVIPEMYGLWRDIAEEISQEYPNIELEFIYADAINMKLVLNPSQYDVIIAPNLFGDIITDLGAMISGGLGMAPGANINPNGTSMFEGIHGSAPDIAGKNIANPCATILSGAHMLKFLGENLAASKIESAVERVLVDEKVRTKDLGGDAKTSEMGDEICKYLLKEGE